MKKVTDIVAEIAAASREQSAGIDQVNKAVMQLDELTQQNAALVEEATAASQTMAEQAKGLNDSMQRFHVKGSAATSAAAPSTPARHRHSRRPPSAARRAGRGLHVIKRPRKRRRPQGCVRHGRLGLEGILIHRS